MSLCVCVCVWACVSLSEQSSTTNWTDALDAVMAKWLVTKLIWTQLIKIGEPWSNVKVTVKCISNWWKKIAKFEKVDNTVWNESHFLQCFYKKDIVIVHYDNFYNENNVHLFLKRQNETFSLYILHIFLHQWTNTLANYFLFHILKNKKRNVR